MAAVDLAGISDAVRRGDAAATKELVKGALESGMDPLRILNEALVPGIEALSSAFREGGVYLPEVLIAARAMNRGLEVLAPHLPRQSSGRSHTVVIGTVSGDVHDIGKNLVRMMLECSGFRVIDLGVDVAAEAFVQATREHAASIVALSALLTTTMTSMPKVISAIRAAGLVVPVLVGGAPVTAAFATKIGADGYAPDCVTAVDEVRRVLGEAP